MSILPASSVGLMAWLLLGGRPRYEGSKPALNVDPARREGVFASDARSSPPDAAGQPGAVRCRRAWMYGLNSLAGPGAAISKVRSSRSFDGQVYVNRKRGPGAPDSLTKTTVDAFG